MQVERIVDDPDRARAVIAAGGVLERHSLIMVADVNAPGLTTEVNKSDPRTIEAMDADRVGDYAAVICRAYPPEHPDHEPGDNDPAIAAESIGAYLRGDVIGPWLADASLHALDVAGDVLGAIVVNDSAAGPALDAGPFVTDVFVDPRAAGSGVGAGLIRASCDRLRLAGWTSVSLVVTVGNPARALYERLGFEVRHEVWRVASPG